MHKDIKDNQIDSRESNQTMAFERKLFQLQQLPENLSTPLDLESMFKDVQMKNFTSIDQHLAQFEPLYVIEDQTNYSQCLQLCVDQWAKIRLGDIRRDRCRLVLVKQTIEQSKRFIGNRPVKYRKSMALY